VDGGLASLCCFSSTKTSYSLSHNFGLDGTVVSLARLTLTMFTCQPLISLLQTLLAAPLPSGILILISMTKRKMQYLTYFYRRFISTHKKMNYLQVKSFLPGLL
jgi:hypothetical protein